MSQAPAHAHAAAPVLVAAAVAISTRQDGLEVKDGRTTARTFPHPSQKFRFPSTP